MFSTRASVFIPIRTLGHVIDFRYSDTGRWITKRLRMQMRLMCMCTGKVVYMCVVRFHRRNTILAFTSNVITRNSGQCTKKKRHEYSIIKKKKMTKKDFIKQLMEFH